MQIHASLINGVQLMDFDLFQDARGDFVKIFHVKDFLVNGIDLCAAELFYSRSKRNVIRGMHFQSPPDDHAKLVTVFSGRVLDVVLDIRRSSSTYGGCASFELSRERPQAVFIPRGCAHGFLSLTDDAGMIYMTTSVHESLSDQGIRWDSFGFEWPVMYPDLSERDKALPPLQLFNTPFE